jgi:hypothetical protein
LKRIEAKSNGYNYIPKEIPFIWRMTKKQGGETIQEKIEVLKGKENTEVPKNTSEEKQTSGK